MQNLYRSFSPLIRPHHYRRLSTLAEYSKLHELQPQTFEPNQPFRSSWGLSALLKGTSTRAGRSWNQTESLLINRRLLCLLSHSRPLCIPCSALSLRSTTPWIKEAVSKDRPLSCLSSVVLSVFLLFVVLSCFTIACFLVLSYYYLFLIIICYVSLYDLFLQIFVCSLDVTVNEGNLSCLSSLNKGLK